MWEKHNTLFVIIGLVFVIGGFSLVMINNFLGIIPIVIGGILFLFAVFGQRKYKGSKLD